MAIDICGAVNISAGEKHRGVASKDNLWQPGSLLTVSFMDGGNNQKNAVLGAIQEWTQYANIRFLVISGSSEMVRVSFQGEGCYAYVGKLLLSVPAHQPNVVLSCVREDGDPILNRAYALHEFGHVLGLTHEHQSPDISFEWNTQALYDYFHRIHGWNKDRVNENLLAEVEHPVNGPFDPDSIMMYPISSEFTMGGFEHPNRNLVLSEEDKRFISSLYPQGPRLRGAA